MFKLSLSKRDGVKRNSQDTQGVARETADEPSKLGGRWTTKGEDARRKSERLTEEAAVRAHESKSVGGDGGTTTTRSPEIGGPKGLEPTRYGDWEKAGRCIDF